MRPKRLFTRLWLSHTALIVVTLLVLGGLFNYLLQHYLAKNREQQLIRVAKTLSNNNLVKRSLLDGDSNTLGNITKQISQSTEADVVLVDAAGNVVASTNPGITKGPLNRQEVKDVLSGTVYSHWGGTFLGVPSFTAGHPVRVKNKIIGAVFLDASLKGFQASLFRFRLLILYAALLALILAAIISYFLAKSISRPIMQMSKAAQALARGEQARVVHYEGLDELADLVGVFNRAVREVQNTLEQQHKLEEQRREFVANVSHEFRAPVTSLQGFLELMQDGVIPETERPHYYELMLKDTARLNRLVSDLLDLARFQAGQGKIKPVPLDPGLLADEVVTKLTPRAVEQGVKLYKRWPPTLPLVLADGDRVEQILVNLLDNALRFTPSEGTIELEIEPHTQDTVIRVKDSGMGIPPEDLPHIFERFYKVDKARTPDKGGTGLGLAIVKELVHAHGGKIEVASTPGRGTVFSFNLPNVKE